MVTPYSNELRKRNNKPFKKGPRCQFLGSWEEPCYSHRTRPEKYHGDSEIYPCLGEKPCWVCVYLCEKHSSE